MGYALNAGKYCKKGSRYPPLCSTREATSGNTFKKNPLEEREARDPSPDLGARQDFWRVMGDYVYLNHVAPKTKLFVPKHDFLIPLNYINIQRHKKNRSCASRGDHQ